MRQVSKAGIHCSFGNRLATFQLPLPVLDPIIDDQIRVRCQAIAERVELAPQVASDQDVDDLVAFLHTLTDLSCLDLHADVPAQVPSGLPIFD